MKITYKLGLAMALVMAVAPAAMSLDSSSWNFPTIGASGAAGPVRHAVKPAQPVQWVPIIGGKVILGYFGSIKPCFDDFDTVYPYFISF